MKRLLLGALAGFALVAVTARADTTPVLAGFHVPVGCGYNGPADGVYHDQASQPSIELRPMVCVNILEARAGVAGPEQAEAVHLLGHELAHSYGVVDERVADCVGVDLIGLAASVLRIPDRAAWRLYRYERAMRRSECGATS